MAIEVAKTQDWLEVEKILDQKEKDLLAKEGVVIPEHHLAGYKYENKTEIVDLQPWDVFPMPPRGKPMCGLENWWHRDVTFEVGQGIAYITLNRPDANNALTESMAQGLSDACYTLHKRTDIRVVVLKAEGKMFCAGGDAKSFADQEAKTDRANKKESSTFIRFLYYLQNLPQFTIALAQGSCMGNGLGLLAVCDMVVAVKTAKFTSTEVKIGQTPISIAPFLSTKVGVANAKRILCLAESLSAPQAMAMGLVQEVVEDAKEDFTGVVAEICEKLVYCAPIATSRSKRLVQNVNNQPITPSIMQYTAGELATIRIAEEAIKGMVAVQARTKPFWAEIPIKPFY